jgi:hypothetical protein
MKIDYWDLQILYEQIPHRAAASALSSVSRQHGIIPILQQEFTHQINQWRKPAGQTITLYQISFGNDIRFRNLMSGFSSSFQFALRESGQPDASQTSQLTIRVHTAVSLDWPRSSL